MLLMYRERVPTTPPLAALRAFDAAARHLSFRAAAEELSVTQSAISHQIAELERRLGVAMFHRHSRRVELTDAGALYHPYVREAFDRIEQGTALVTLGAPSRELDVQVYVTVAVRWLIPRLHQFGAAHPNVRVRLNTSHLDWEFAETESDVAIVCTLQPERPGVSATHLFDAELVAVCSPRLLPADLGTQPLLQVFTAPEETEVWLAAAGRVDAVVEGGSRFDSYLLAIEAAIDGQGIAVVPSFLVAADLRSGRLVEPFGVRAPQPRHWFMVCRAEQRDQSPVVQFRDWLEAEVLADGLSSGAA
jgi:LysR family transcriptional regulator, glycine cleavage system transcriptional activator